MDLYGKGKKSRHGVSRIMEGTVTLLTDNCTMIS